MEYLTDLWSTQEEYKFPENSEVSIFGRFATRISSTTEMF